MGFYSKGFSLALLKNRNQNGRKNDDWNTKDISQIHTWGLNYNVVSIMQVFLAHSAITIGAAKAGFSHFRKGWNSQIVCF